jgi:hypothetical protein
VEEGGARSLLWDPAIVGEGSRSRRYGSVLSKHVLQLEWRTRELYAWELLRAVEELFPERIQGLKSITSGFDLEKLRERLDIPILDEEQQFLERLERRVHKWTEANKIASPTVDQVASRFSLGFAAPAEAIVGTIDDQGNELQPPSLLAYPYDETKREFLARARLYWDEVLQFYQDPQKPKPAKRDLVHFRDLVAFLIGGYSWAEIAGGRTPFRLPHRSDKTVAGEARKLGSLLGISMPVHRGPRPGTRRHRRTR